MGAQLFRHGRACLGQSLALLAIEVVGHCPEQVRPRRWRSVPLDQPPIGACGSRLGSASVSVAPPFAALNSGNPYRVQTCSTQRRRRSGLRSFPRRLPSGSSVRSATARLRCVFSRSSSLKRRACPTFRPPFLAPPIVRLLGDAQGPAHFGHRVTARQADFSLTQLDDDLFRGMSLPWHLDLLSNGPSLTFRLGQVLGGRSLGMVHALGLVAHRRLGAALPLSQERMTRPLRFCPPPPNQERSDCTNKR